MSQYDMLPFYFIKNVKSTNYHQKTNYQKINQKMKKLMI